MESSLTPDAARPRPDATVGAPPDETSVADAQAAATAARDTLDRLESDLDAAAKAIESLPAVTEQPRVMPVEESGGRSRFWS